MRRIPCRLHQGPLPRHGKLAERARYAELADGSRRRVPDAQDTDDQGL